MDSIAKTSLLTAAMRAAETKRSESEGRLFVDPYAELLAGDEGMAIRDRAIAASGDQPAIAIRTLFIDLKIAEAMNAGVRQIVMLAAGMDTRAYRLNFLQGTKVFELDREEVCEYKSHKLDHVKPFADLTRIAVDLRKAWKENLLRAGFIQNAKTLWLVEGLLMYLEPEEVSVLLSRINELAHSNDYLLCDILSETLLNAPFMANQLKFLESMGAPWKFGTDEPEAYLKEFGWKAKATQAGEFSPSRWPFPVIPRHIPNVPRGFYLEAQKV